MEMRFGSFFEIGLIALLLSAAVLAAVFADSGRIGGETDAQPAGYAAPDKAGAAD